MSATDVATRLWLRTDAKYAELREEVEAHVEALQAVRPLTPHVQGCDEPDDPHCARCVLDSELARLAEVVR